MFVVKVNIGFDCWVLAGGRPDFHEAYKLACEVCRVWSSSAVRIERERS